jgi:hypothetical protein
MLFVPNWLHRTHIANNSAEAVSHMSKRGFSGKWGCKSATNWVWDRSSDDGLTDPWGCSSRYSPTENLILTREGWYFLLFPVAPDCQSYKKLQFHGKTGGGRIYFILLGCAIRISSLCRNGWGVSDAQHATENHMRVGVRISEKEKKKSPCFVQKTFSFFSLTR